LNTFIHHQIMQLNKKDRIPTDSWVHRDKVSWRKKMLVSIIKGKEILRKKTSNTKGNNITGNERAYVHQTRSA
jgi:hypothetical protein